eukprot:GEMP01045961.1.p1 GENE.GEMP01045961.1~~GEMP01045961.1.p1  ORF type:complete len:258 (+),score=49.33 GEMP01045961.1:211-984(+)
MWWFSVVFLVASTLLHGAVLTALWRLSSEVEDLKAQVQHLKIKNPGCAFSCFFSRPESDATEKWKHLLDSQPGRFKATYADDDRWRPNFPLRTHTSIGGDWDTARIGSHLRRYDKWPDDELGHDRAGNNALKWDDRSTDALSWDSVPRKREDARRRSFRAEKKRQLRLFEKSYRPALLQSRGEGSIDDHTSMPPLNTSCCSTALLTRSLTQKYDLIDSLPEIASVDGNRTHGWSSKFPRIIHRLGPRQIFRQRWLHT